MQKSPVLLDLFILLCHNSHKFATKWNHMIAKKLFKVLFFLHHHFNKGIIYLPEAHYGSISLPRVYQ